MTATAPLPTRDALAQALANLSDNQFTAAALFLQAVVQAAQTDSLDTVNIYKFRKGLNLKPLLNPTITALPGVVLPARDTPLADRIAAGGYDWHIDDITATNFPITRDAGPQPLFLAHFGVDVSSEEVEAWAQSNGYEVANNDDLLAVGSSEQHKDLQRKLCIVQLGSSTVLRARRLFSSLAGSVWQRDLGLVSVGGDGWHDSCHFLLRQVS